MAQRQHIHAVPELGTLCEGVVSLLKQPAAIVEDAEEIFACNQSWAQISGGRLDSDKRLTLQHSLRDFSRTELLIEALRSDTQPIGIATLTRASEQAAQDHDRAYEIRWRRLTPPTGRGSLAMVLMQDIVAADRAIPPDVRPHRTQRMLLRQTLIEEAERRRIGRALHDVVAQKLAQIRAAIATHGPAIPDAETIIERIDSVISEIRTLTFELSPPVLEDLGLLPALRWLVDHVTRGHSANITLADNAHEPSLSPVTRTIVFRTVRELVHNAIKHAPGAGIIITCVSNHRVARIMVSDNGSGFDQAQMMNRPDGDAAYGLLSVEQQIASVGGAFELVSSQGEGTRAVITVPTHQERHDEHA